MKNIKIKRTTAQDPNFTSLIKDLDRELAITDGEDHAFYDQFNKVDKIQHVVLLHENDWAVACGALKAYDPRTAEVKRMYTRPESRGNAYAGKVLQELENWAADLGFNKCILETGINQPEAIRLYQKMGYNRMDNYGQYAGVEKSYCFMKEL